MSYPHYSTECHEHHDLVCDFKGPKPRPKIVTLCGSTRFYTEFQKINYELTMTGVIVLTVGFYPHSMSIAHGKTVGCTAEEKILLDELHKRKIDLSDEIFVLNVDGYIGESTRSEIEGRRGRPAGDRSARRVARTVARAEAGY